MIRRPNFSHYRSAVIIYYKDPLKCYKKEWIDKCIQSIEKQTIDMYDVFILNYGTDNRYLDQIIEREIKFPNLWEQIYNPKIINHVHAMNYLLDLCFKRDHKPYDVVFNTNIDDYYSVHRFHYQLQAIWRGYELISTEFEYIKDEGGFDAKLMSLRFGECDIKHELLKRNTNVLCHPSIAYTKDFWIKHGPYEDAIPTEDLLLWQKAAHGGCKIYIVPEILTHYRIHDNQISGIGRTWNL